MHGDTNATLLILGGSGFLGSHLLHRSRDWWKSPDGAPGRVVTASRTPAAYRLPGTPPEIEKRVFDAVAEEPECLLDEVGPELVVCSAALSRIADCEGDPDRAFRLNAHLPARLASWCADHGTRLVHVSTDLVFGGAAPRGERYAESDPPSPLHEYGRSKVLGEKKVLSILPEALVVRLPLLFGDSAGRALGASDALFAAIERGERPGLFRDEMRSPMDAGNAAQALLEAAVGESSGYLHIAGPLRMSRFELGLELLALDGWEAQRARRAVRELCRADLGMESTRAADCSLDTSRARELLETPLDGPGTHPLRLPVP